MALPGWLHSLLGWRSASPSPGGPPIRTAVSDQEVAALRDLSRNELVLEIGSAYGFSTVVLAQQAAHVWAVDPHSGFWGKWGDSRSAMLANLAAYGVSDRVTVLDTTSVEACPWIPAGLGLVFIDGCHSYECATFDLNCAADRLRWGGRIAMDDYLNLSGVRRAVDDWKRGHIVAMAGEMAILEVVA